MSITDTLRKLVRDGDESRYAISKATGINQSALSRFLREGKLQGDLRGESLDKLAEYYGLELKPKRGKR